MTGYAFGAAFDESPLIEKELDLLCESKAISSRR
jgi:hypothetical protein